MTVRLGRVMRGMLETVLDLQSRPDAFSSKEFDQFVHEYRKPLNEMRKARRVPTQNSATLAAIKSAKSCNVTEVLLDDL